MCQCGQVGIWQGTQALSLPDISLRVSWEMGNQVGGLLMDTYICRQHTSGDH
jgi:hypothetical protein